MNIPIQNGQLPMGFCPPDFQTMLNAFSAAQFAVFSSLSSLVVSSSPPADHTVAWLRLDSFGNPVRIYFFAQGAWLSPHPLLPGFTMLWNQALPNFTTYDGGDASIPPFSAITGQMWQLMAATTNGLDLGGKKPGDAGYVNPQVMVAQFPVGVGTFPAPPAGSGVMVSVAGTGGFDQHVLAAAEVPAHTHQVGSQDSTADVGGDIAQEFVRSFGSGTGPPATSSSFGSTPNNAFGTLPPYYGVYFLQRTNRLFYTV